MSKHTTNPQLTESAIVDAQNKQKNNIDASKVLCRTCLKEISPTRRCGGHSASGGGGSSEGSGETSKNSTGASQTNSTTDLTSLTDNLVAENIAQPDNDTEFDSEVISELLSKNLLILDDDKELGILTIKLQCDFHLLSENQKNNLNIFFNVVLKELNVFKSKNSISANCITIDKDEKGNTLALRISLPTPTLYQAFIQQLTNKNLLLTQNKEQPKNKNRINSTFFSSKSAPVPMEPNAQEDTTRKLPHPRSPIAINGPKPKGWQ